MSAQELHSEVELVVVVLVAVVEVEQVVKVLVFA